MANDTKDKEVAILGTTGSNNTIVVVEKEPDGSNFTVATNVGEDELLTFDTKTKKFKGTGVIAKDGSISTEPGSVDIGIHKISSGGKHLYVTEEVTKKAHSLLWQDVDITGDTKPYAIKLGPLQTRVVVQSDNSTPLVNPNFEFQVPAPEVIFSFYLIAGAMIRTLESKLYVKIDGKWEFYIKHTYAGNIGAGEFKFDFIANDSPPLELTSGQEYKIEFSSPNGDVVILGAPSGMIFYALDSRLKEEVQLATITDIPPTDPSHPNYTKIQQEITNLKTFQNQATLKHAALEAADKVLENNINQKISGIHVEDVKNNALDDINSLHFVGAEVTDDGSSQATVTIKPEFSVSNGFTPGSTSVTAKALEFSGANIGIRDPSGAAVATIEIPPPTNSGISGITVSDGSSSASDIKTLILDGQDLIHTDDTAKLQTPFRHFATISERDAWATKHGTLVGADVIAVVDADSNGVTSWYRFDTSVGERKWVEYDAQGVILSDSAGSTSKSIRNMTFGEGFKVTQDANNSDTATVSYTPSEGSLDVEQEWGANTKVAKVNTMSLRYPLEVAPTGTGPGQSPDGVAALGIKLGTYEPVHAPGYLAYLSDQLRVTAKIPANIASSHHKGALWFDDVVASEGLYISTSMANKTYSISEADDLDPKVSGGTDYLIVLRLHFNGTAPSDGSISAYIYNPSISPISPAGYLKDVNGEQMRIERHYERDDRLETIEIIGVVNVKGTTSFSCHVMHNFTTGAVILNDRIEGESGLLIQAIQSGNKTGHALQQFELDTQQSIEFLASYLGEDRVQLKYQLLDTMTPEVKPGGTIISFADGLQLHAVRPTLLDISGGVLTLQDDGTNLGDFSFGKIFSSDETRILQGKQVTFTAKLEDKNAGWTVALMKWTGIPEAYPNAIYSTRNNGVPEFTEDWVKADELFISEDVVSGEHVVTKTFTVPTDANNYAIIIYPAAAQQPLALKLTEFKVDVTNPFIGYTIHESSKLEDIHLMYDSRHARFAQGTRGYASLRYTINNTYTPLPIGTLTTGFAKISVDPSANQVVGSQAGGGEGALSFGEAGTIAGSIRLLIWNEQSTNNPLLIRLAQVGPDGTVTDQVIAQTAVTAPANSTGIYYIFNIPPTQVEVGERWALQARGTSQDAAFLQSTTPSKPLVICNLTYEEVINGDSGDSPDLVALPAIKKLVVDRRVVEFSGVTSPNYVISGLDIPSDVELALHQVVSKSGNIVTSVDSSEFSYNSVTKELTVHVGNHTDGKIYLEFWG